jgi:hypothetical protein
VACLIEHILLVHGISEKKMHILNLLFSYAADIVPFDFLPSLLSENFPIKVEICAFMC